MVSTMVASRNDMFTLVGFGCEAFLHGCHTCLFVVSIYITVKRSRNKSGVNRHIFIISIFLYLSCLAHFILDFIRCYTTLATTGVKGFGNETHEKMAADFILSVTDFIGEVILIYRCWLLWNRKYCIIMFPSLCAIGGLASACAILLLLVHVDQNSSMPPSALFPLAETCLFLPLGANVVVTILIAGRIWYHSPHNIDDLGPVRVRFRTGRAALGIVIESGMLYLAAQLTFVVLFIIRHPAQDIALVIAVQIYGIAPALIIIRAALGLSNTNTLSGSSPTAGGPTSQPKPAAMRVRIGFSTSAFSRSSQPSSHLGSKEIRVPVSPIRSAPSSGEVVGLDSSVDAASVA